MHPYHRPRTPSFPLVRTLVPPTGVLLILLVLGALGHVQAAAAPGQPAMHASRMGLVTPRPRMAAPHDHGLEESYPRLANYNGFSDAVDAPFFADNNLVVARRGAALDALRRVNPRALTLLYERTLQVDYWPSARDTPHLYGLRTTDVPPGWWLTRAGSQLMAPLDPTATRVAVADPRPFAACQDVLIGGETMHVLGVAGGTLRVRRGYESAAAAHAVGTPLAPHYSYRGDLSNCHVDGSNTDRRPWSLNLSILCPRWHGLTWADFLARRVALLVRSGGWDGVFYDNMPDLPPNPLVNTTGDGRADGGVVRGVNRWREGERALLAATRRLLPGRPVLLNGDLLANGLANGREMEGFPLIPGADLTAAVDAYRYDGDHGLGKTIVNGDTNGRHQPSAAAAQLTVGIAALGSGYAAYDYGWLRHGWPWWFGVYAPSADSVLRRGVGATASLLTLTEPRRDAPGTVLLLDQEAIRILHVGAGQLVVQRGVRGTRPAPHLAGTTVTTLAERQAGAGYLGMPRGAARLEATGNGAERLLTPVSVGPAPRSAGAVERLFSTGFYDPFARRATYSISGLPRALRTLTFSVRGPEGEQLWLRVGKSLLRLVLSAAWRIHVLPIDGAAAVVFGVGRVRGNVSITGVTLRDGQAFVFRRDFTRGAVFVNTTDVVQHLPLHCHGVLAGESNQEDLTPPLLVLAPYHAALVSTTRGSRC